MYSELTDVSVLPIGFARSLVWATGVTMITLIIVTRVPDAQLQRWLPGMLMGAAMFYPLIAAERLREVLRATFLVALLLVPLVVGSTQPVIVSLFAAAVVIGLLRCWQYSSRQCALGWHWRRECSCLGASLLFGSILLGAKPLDQVFTVWGFCLGQLVSTLFSASIDTAPPISAGR